MNKYTLNRYRSMRWEPLGCQECDTSDGPFVIYFDWDGAEILCFSCILDVRDREEEVVASGKKSRRQLEELDAVVDRLATTDS